MAGQILPTRWLPYWHTFDAGEVAGVEGGEEEAAAPSAAEGRRC
jgi:hypothetical protein